MGIKPDPARAREVNERGCKLGSLQACLQLSALYRSGKAGEKPDAARAEKVLAEACDQKLEGACLEASRLAGAAGVRYLERGCEQNHAPSCQQLGEARQKQDPEGARAAFQRACSQGLGAACTRSGELAKALGHASEAVAAFNEGCARKEARSCEAAAKLTPRGP